MPKKIKVDFAAGQVICRLLCAVGVQLKNVSCMHLAKHGMLKLVISLQYILLFVILINQFLLVVFMVVIFINYGRG